MKIGDGYVEQKKTLRIITTDNVNTLWATDDELRIFYFPSGTATGLPNAGNVWFGFLYGKWNYPIQVIIGLTGMFMRSGYVYNDERIWNPWKQIIQYP